MKKNAKWSMGIIGSLLCAAVFVQAETGPEHYNVTWDTPSVDFNGSMPLGNGSLGLNAWIEKNGDLVFYISRTDSWGDNGDLMKVGKVRISVDPRPSLENFEQTLSLADGSLYARYGTTQIRLWVDAHRSVIHAELTTDQETHATAAVELWRIKDPIPPHPLKPASNHDVILKSQQGQIGWYHRNTSSILPELAETQGVGDYKRVEPLIHRTSGAIIRAKNAKRVDDTHLLSPASKTHRFDIYAVTKHPVTEAEWLHAVNTTMTDAEKTPLDTRRKAHETWWKAFWQRSWIHAVDSDSNEATLVSQGYALQRYINACGGKGPHPIKFNGSIFTVPNGTKKDVNNPDARRWGAKYTWQNTRLPYYSMCTSGDVELTQPLFQMYCIDQFDYMKARTLAHTGHGGIYIPENVYFSGDSTKNNYGTQPCSERVDKLQTNPYHKWEWVSGLELSFLMFERYEHTLDTAFLQNTMIPFATEILRFFDLQYKVGNDGKLVMHPSQSCETWWDCTNPMPEVAGLHAIADRLLGLPETLTTSKQRAYWASVKKKVPTIPTHEFKGKTMLAPAERFDHKKNVENPELYAVFPFRHIAVGKPNIELGIEALNHRLHEGARGWRQDDLFMAYLGQTDQVKDYIITRVKAKAKDQRFLAFWGPNFDWTPDQTHGGVILKTFQSMIMQTDGKKIYLMPAWPKNWDAEFKLHAPYKTIVKGTVKNGKLVELNIEPASRKKDVVILPVK